MSRRRHAANGFTLLELIVVLAVFGVFSAMAYGGLNYVLKARQRIEAQLNRTAAWQKAYQRVRNDLELAVPRTARDGFGESRAAVLYEEFGRRVELSRAGWRNPLSLPRPGIERIVYRYDDQHHQLRRDTWHVLDRAEDNDPMSLVLLDEIDAVDWRFLDSNQVWQSRWPPDGSTATTASAVPMPRAFELTLKSADLGSVRWVLRPNVEVPANGALDSTTGTPATPAGASPSGSSSGTTGTATGAVTPVIPSTTGSSGGSDATP